MELLQSSKDQEVLKEYISKIEYPNCYVEIGTHQGGSGIIASESTKRPVYSIDNACKLEDALLCSPKFNFILGDSQGIADMWKDPRWNNHIWNNNIQVLFIDGDHFGAGKDFEAWKDKVINGGYVLFHDYCKHPERTVVKDCDEIMEKYKDKFELVFKPSGNYGTSILVLKKK